MRSKIKFTEPTMTVQSDTAETNINTIIERARVSGFYSSRNSKEPIYLDCSNIGDYQACLDHVKIAQEAFDSLPARVRDRFMNNPTKMVEFVSNPSNRAEAQELGLLQPDLQKNTPPVKVATPEKP